MMKIYFTFDPRPDLKEDLLGEFPEIDFIFRSSVENDILKTAEILVTYGEDLNDEYIEIADKLQWIMVVSAGLEKMPLQKIAERGIAVSNVRGIHKIPMAESVLAHILAYNRKLPWVYDNKRNAEWNRKAKYTELHGSTAVILGPGAIGGEIGRLLQCFDVHTIGCNRSGGIADYMHDMVTFENLNTVLPTADYVISVLPCTKETHHLISEEHFKLMKNSAMFMNFGRGDLVSTEVLKQALLQNEIAYAVCDVFEDEPLSKNHPFWKMDNIMVSPHISSHSSRYLERSFEIFKPSLRKWLAGDKQLENMIDPQKGY